MFLRPQHFQQFERFIEYQAVSRQRYLTPYFWGVTKLELDASLLLLGKIAVASAEGVFPDGSMFSVSYDPEFPLAVQLHKGQEEQVVYIAIPPQIKGAVDSDDSALSRGVRYRQEQTDIRDSHGVNNERVYPISTGVLNATLVTEDHLEDQLISLPIARVSSINDDGSLVLDPLFGVPTLDISINRTCTTGVADLILLMKDKAKQLAASIESGVGNGAGTVVDLLMLKSLNCWVAELSILIKQNPLHPYELFKHLSAFIAEVSTFTRTDRIAEIDCNYNHIESAQQLLKLVESARVLVSTASKSKATSLPIQRRKFGISIVGLPTESMVDDDFILAIKADLSSEHIRKLVGNKLKVGSIDNIKDLVNLQLPGCTKERLPVTPRQIPYHTGMTYFRLLPDEDMKASIKRSSGIGIHISGDVPGLEFELWVVSSD